MSTCSERLLQRQHGNVLFEALIGVLLTGVIGVGFAQIGSRVAVSHHELRVEGAAVQQLREQLSENGQGICASTTVAIGLPNDATVSGAVECLDEPDVTVHPSEVAASAPTDTVVKGVRPVTITVDVAHLGVASTDGATIKVGTQQ